MGTFLLTLKLFIEGFVLDNKHPRKIELEAEEVGEILGGCQKEDLWPKLAAPW